MSFSFFLLSFGTQVWGAEREAVSPACASGGSNHTVAVATVWHSSVITANSEFFPLKSVISQRDIHRLKMGRLFQQNDCWHENGTRWGRGFEVIFKVGCFSHKVVTFSKMQSSAELSCWVLSSHFPPKLKCSILNYRPLSVSEPWLCDYNSGVRMRPGDVLLTHVQERLATLIPICW